MIENVYDKERLDAAGKISGGLGDGDPVFGQHEQENRQRDDG